MNENCLTDKESILFLEALFPSGLVDIDVQKELVSDGWDHSPYKAVFHPPPEQRYEEYIQIRRNLKKLSKKHTSGEDYDKEPDFEEFCRDLKDHPVEPDRELTELMGLCLWDIFSDSHEVISPDGRIVDLGSQRGSAAFIAKWLNKKQEAGNYTYLDFYMGTAMISQRADLTPVYRIIFQRIYKAGGDWIYHFPRLYLVRPPKDEKPPDEPETYDPAKAVTEEIEKKEKEKKNRELEEMIRQGNREAAEEAAQGEPPRIVVAYKDAYGHFPDGWPPV